MSEQLGIASRARGTVHLERRFTAPPERVWAAWTDPARMSRWLAPVDGTPGPDAVFVLRMEPGVTATCTVTRWEPPETLALVWDFASEGPSRLNLALHPDGTGTRLVLDHQQIPSDPVDYAAGWHAQLDLLDADLAGTPPPPFEQRYTELYGAYSAATSG